MAISEVPNPTDVIAVTEKAGPFDDSWFEPPSDLQGGASEDGGATEPVVALNRHSGGLNATFLDGHARRLSREALLKDPCGEPYSGVSLLRAIPVPAADFWTPNCTE